MFCIDCRGKGVKQKLKFTMLNFTCGVWLCPQKECTFPLSSDRFANYMKEDAQLDNATLTSAAEKDANRVKKTKPSHVHRKRYLKERNSEVGNEALKLAVARQSSCIGKDSECHRMPASDSDSGISRSSENSFPSEFPLWPNAESLCWLDVSLVLLCLNRTLRECVSLSSVLSANCLIKRLYHQYDIILLQFMESYRHSVVLEDLIRIREQLWTFLQPKLILKKGDCDSPLFALPLLLKENQDIREQVETSYRIEYTCTACKLHRVSRFKKSIISLPNCSSDFCLPHKMCFLVNCFDCGAAAQRSYICLESLPSVLMLHFAQGAPNMASWIHFNFAMGSTMYDLTQVIQYTNQHFVCWSYDAKVGRWLRADDLKDRVGRYEYFYPKCPFEEGHILVWEKVNSEANVDSVMYSSQPVSTPETSFDPDLSCSLNSIDPSYFFDSDSPLLDPGVLPRSTTGSLLTKTDHFSLEDILGDLPDMVNGNGHYKRLQHCLPSADSAYSSPADTA